MVTRSAQELTDDVARAIQILSQFTDSGKRDVKFLIPPSILANAHGLMFIRLYRGGFMVSAKKGTGVIIARLPDGSWSAPSGISMGALGFGHQAGVEVIDSIIVMNYRGAVKAFFDGGGQMQLGASMSISAGPLGRAADVAASTANGQHISATYAYSSSKGLFAGYSFEGSKISERVNTNAAFYGRNINAREILTGGVARPPQAQRLYDMLTSLGAGPRPGLPFAPKKGRMSMPPPQQQQHPSFYNNQQHPSQGSFHQPQSPYQSTPPPPQQFNNNPPGMGGAAMGAATAAAVASQEPWQQTSFQKPPEQHDLHNLGFDEPPPPYEPSKEDMFKDGGGTAAAAAATTGDVKHNPYTSEIQQQSDLQRQSSTSSSPFSPSLSSTQPSITAAAPVAASNPFDTNASSSSSNNNNNNNNNNNVAPGYTASSGYEHYYGNDTKKDPHAFEQQEQMTVVIAKYDFNGEQPGDLTFSAGDHIIVTQRKGDRQAWWEGEIGSRKGMFPANYTEDMS